MKKIFFLTSFFFLFFLQQSKPETTKNQLKNSNADYTVLSDYQYINIKSKQSYTYKRKVKYMILNENAKNILSLTLGYNKFIKITKLKTTLYNILGKEISKSKKSDIKDYGDYTNSAFFSDHRYKYISTNCNKYPCIIEYEYEIKEQGSFGYYPMYAQPSNRAEVKEAVLSLSYPSNMTIKYKTPNVTIEPEIVTGSTMLLTWTFKDLKPYDDEPYAAKSSLPHIKIKSEEFEYDNFEGKLTTLADLGTWVSKLNQKRDEIPAATIEQYKQLIAGSPTTAKKIKLIYNHIQSQTRYVNISLGIGTLQPMKAEDVDQNKYGDCKALSNYTVSVLKALGIEAYYVLVNSGTGENNLDKSFPSSQFDHVIVCAPNQGDTIWLETTSAFMPFNFLGDFTDDRYGLLIVEENSKLIKTPTYTCADNQQVRKTEVHILSESEGKAKSHTLYTGILFEEIAAVNRKGTEEQKKWLYRNLDLNNIKINGFSFTFPDKNTPYIEENLDIELKHIAKKTAGRLFVNPNLMNKKTFIPHQITNRRTDIQLDIAFQEIDTILYHLPQNYTIESIPKPVDLETEFGQFHSKTYTAENNTLIYVRNYKRKKGVFPKEKYTEFYEFQKAIVKADKQKFVLKAK